MTTAERHALLELAEHFRGEDAAQGVAVARARMNFGDLGDWPELKEAWIPGQKDAAGTYRPAYAGCAAICESLAYDNTDGPS